MNPKDLENQSIYIIREAVSEFKNVPSLWSVGKDSTCLLWLFRKTFFGKIPFPIIHIDTGFKFPQMYKFRDKLVKEDWDTFMLVFTGTDRLCHFLWDTYEDRTHKYDSSFLDHFRKLDEERTRRLKADKKGAIK